MSSMHFVQHSIARRLKRHIPMGDASQSFSNLQAFRFGYSYEKADVYIRRVARKLSRAFIIASTKQ